MRVLPDPHRDDVEWAVFSGTRYWRFRTGGWCVLDPERFTEPDVVLAESTQERVAVWVALALGN